MVQRNIARPRYAYMQKLETYFLVCVQVVESQCFCRIFYIYKPFLISKLRLNTTDS